MGKRVFGSNAEIEGRYTIDDAAPETECRTFAEVGQRFGISRQVAQRIEVEAVRKLWRCQVNPDVLARMVERKRK